DVRPRLPAGLDPHSDRAPQSWEAIGSLRASRLSEAPSLSFLARARLRNQKGACPFTGALALTMYVFRGRGRASSRDSPEGHIEGRRISNDKDADQARQDDRLDWRDVEPELAPLLVLGDDLESGLGDRPRSGQVECCPADPRRPLYLQKNRGGIVG